MAKELSFTFEELQNAYISGEAKGKAVARNPDYYCYSSTSDRFVDFLMETYPKEKVEKILGEMKK